MSVPPSRETITSWLLEGEPWLGYLVKRDLLHAAEDGLEEESEAAAGDPRIRGLVNEVSSWPWPPLCSHKSAAHPIHKLSFLSDLGMEPERLGLEGLVDDLLAAATEEGLFQVPMVIPKHFGGSGEDENAWALCDAPLICRSLVKMGRTDLAMGAVDRLMSLGRENGWPCATSPKLGGFRGPGRKADPCPYANLVMVELLAEIPGLREGRECRAGAEAALDLWARSREVHPYQFHMGTDFRKLKAPLVWYDLLHVTDVLSRLPWLRTDTRLREMAGLVISKCDERGRFTPESVWTTWRGWDFGQKKEPSRGLSFLAWRALDRMGSWATY